MPIGKVPMDLAQPCSFSSLPTLPYLQLCHSTQSTLLTDFSGPSLKLTRLSNLVLNLRTYFPLREPFHSAAPYIMDGLSAAANVVSIVSVSIKLLGIVLKSTSATTQLLDLAMLVDELAQSLDHLREAKVATDSEFASIAAEAFEAATDLLEMNKKLDKSRHAPLLMQPVSLIRVARARKVIHIKMDRLLALQYTIQTTM